MTEAKMEEGCMEDLMDGICHPPPGAATCHLKLEDGRIDDGFPGPAPGLECPNPAPDDLDLRPERNAPANHPVSGLPLSVCHPGQPANGSTYLALRLTATWRYHFFSPNGNGLSGVLVAFFFPDFSMASRVRVSTAS